MRAIVLIPNPTYVGREATQFNMQIIYILSSDN